MTPKQLERAGQHLHGRWWKAKLAADLHISKVQLWRYLTGRALIPGRTAALVRLMVQAK